MKINISVIMTVFNENSNELHNSILSILNQTYPYFELIIVDDNPLRTGLKRYLKRVSYLNDRVVIIFNKKNLGAANSRNKGIRNAKGKFIAIQDADDISIRKRLESQLQFLQCNNLDFVFSNFGKISDNNNILRRKNYDMKTITNKYTINYIFSYIGNIANCSNWFLKKNIFSVIGGYRNTIVEDYDFLAKSIIKGYKLGYQDKVLLFKKYRYNSTMRQNSLQVYLAIRYIKSFLQKAPKRMFSVKKFNKYISKNVSRNRINHFNNFMMLGHLYRYTNNKYRKFFYSIKLLYSILTTKFSLSFIVNMIYIEFQIKKLKFMKN